MKIAARSVWTLFLGALACAAQQPQPATWLEPTKAEPAGTRYRTFQSKTINGEVSYLLYVPPDYETNKDKRYPVVYWLHGLGGDQRTGAAFVERLDTAIRNHVAPPMIAVLVNGMRSSMYCDSADGKVPVESVIIKDLIPHVDAKYRTIASRQGRAIEGFSMGGFGAARLGFKHPDLFGVVSILAGALHTADTLAERRTQIFQTTFGGNKDYYQAESPWTVVEKSADAIRGRTHVRIWVGDQDMLLEWNTQYHELLNRLKIAHEFQVVPGAGHNYRQVHDTIGMRGFAFYKKAMAENDVEIVRDVEYCTGGGRPLRLHTLRPKTPPKDAMPVLVWIHGGGWRGGSRDSGIARLIPFAQRGYFGVTIEYRLSGEAIFPAQIEDSKCAIRFLRARAKQLHVDPERIGVWGSSAGGHLAALLGTAGDARHLEGSGGWPKFSSRVQAVCDWFGPTDFLQMDTAGSKIVHDAPESPESRLIGGPIQQNKDKTTRANPITYVTRDDPPFLIMHGDQDPAVPLHQSQLLYDALKKTGVEATLHVVKGAGHGFHGPELDEMVEAFFDKHLKKQ